jgi:hypothetical protein
MNFAGREDLGSQYRSFHNIYRPLLISHNCILFFLISILLECPRSYGDVDCYVTDPSVVGTLLLTTPAQWRLHLDCGSVALVGNQR